MAIYGNDNFQINRHVTINAPVDGILRSFDLPVGSVVRSRCRSARPASS